MRRSARAAIVLRRVVRRGVVMSGVPSDAVVLFFLTLYIDRGADERVRLSEERVLL